MKKLLSIFLLVVVLFSFAACQPEQPPTPGPVTPPDDNQEEPVQPIMQTASRKSYKLLSVGNSFSDDAQTYMYSILNAFGVQEIVIANLYVGGCDVKAHVNYAATDSPAYVYRKNTSGAFVSSNGMKMSYALADEKWDYVSLQQASGLSGFIGDCKAEINALADFVTNGIDNDDVKSLWHMTWAYQSNSTHQDFVNYHNDQSEMYNAIASSADSVIDNNDKFDAIIPSGTAIQNARTSYIGDTLTRDGYHLEDLGQFIAGLTWVVKTTNWDINDLNFDLIPQKFVRYWDIVEEAVTNAINEPFKVTQSQLLEDGYLNRTLNQYQTTKNVSYSAVSNNCKLDMYLPTGIGNDYPIIVHCHGGGINSGAKDDSAHVAIAKTVASNGVGFVSINYRLYPTAKYPEFIEDAATAVKFVKDYMAQNNLTGKLYVSGQSAGAYIGMMLLFNTEFLAKVGLKVTDIDGWLLESGQPTTHFNVLGADGLDTQLQRVDEKSPMYYVNGKTKFKNLLLISYTNDIACRLSQTKLLYDAIKNYNPYADVTLRVYEGNHCINSTTAYRNHYVHADILIDYVKGA